MFEGSGNGNLVGAVFDDRAIAIANGRASDEWEALARKLQVRVAELELALLVEKAHAEGVTASLDGFKAANPDSPMLRDSGKRYKDGDVKTAGRLRYEKAFDAFLFGKGIADARQFRID